MHEAQSLRMQAQAVQGRCLGTIAAVAYNGVAKVFHVYAYLILASCLELQFHHRILPAGVYGAVASECVLALLGVFG